MVRTAVGFAAVGIVTLFAGCSTTHTKTSSLAADEAAIAAFNKSYLKAINDGDAAALGSLTTEGHIMVAPGRPPLVGKAANIAANGRAYEQFKIDETWSPQETVVSGDLAYQRGTFTVAATPKAGGEARATHGNFLRIYRREPDGSWRMTVDTFNSETTGAPK